MKIVDRQTLLGMPVGTVYAEYQPCYFGDLHIKGDSYENDWLEMSLVSPWFEGVNDSGAWMEKLEEINASGESSPPIDFESYGRDGLFDDTKRYAVWEADDVRGLIAVLQQGLTPQGV